MRSYEEVKTAVLNAIDQHRDEIIAIGDHVWKNPEPGYKEVKTSRYAREILEKYGYSVKDGLCITGLRADLDSGKPGPCVAVLGEMDSLILPTHPECDPATGAVHACGHNSHITAMLGAAMGLKLAGVAADISGKIAFIGTPSEEGGCDMAWRLKMIDEGKIASLGGKESMILAGVFDDVDISLMNHISSKYEASSGTGNIKKRVVIHGKSCHGSTPYKGINALNAMAHAVNALGLIRERLTERMCIHGIVTEGGNAVNIIPDTVVMEYYVRGGTIEDMLKVNQFFDDAVHYSALAVGARASIRTIFGSLPVKNAPGMVETLDHAVHAVHPEFTGTVADRPTNGSTDMGDVTQIMPAIHGYVPGMGGTSHGIDFHIADKEKAYVDAAKIEALMALELVYGDAARGKEIASRREGLLSIEEYRKLFRSLSKKED